MHEKFDFPLSNVVEQIRSTVNSRLSKHPLISHPGLIRKNLSQNLDSSLSATY